MYSGDSSASVAGAPQLTERTTHSSAWRPQSYNHSSPPKVATPLYDDAKSASAYQDSSRPHVTAAPSDQSVASSGSGAWSPTPYGKSSTTSSIFRTTMWIGGLLLVALVSLFSVTLISHLQTQGANERLMAAEASMKLTQLQQALYHMQRNVTDLLVERNSLIQDQNIAAEIVGGLHVEQQDSVEAPAVVPVATTQSPKPTSAISLLIPCSEKHFYRLSDVMESIQFQTYQPHETIIAFSIEDKHDKQLGIKDIAKASMNMPDSFQVHLRGGQHYAGSNREFLAKQATGDVVSYFDCDDMMHPRRIEVLHKIFTANPDLDAALHCYDFYQRKNWNVTEKMKKMDAVINMTAVDNWKPLWPYEKLAQTTPFTKLWGNKTWNINDRESEPPNYLPNVKEHWFFPLNMGLRGFGCSPHNGWLTLRRRVALDVPYPKELRRGQDAVYNWRVIKSKKNFGFLPYRLGTYVFGNPNTTAVKKTESPTAAAATKSNTTTVTQGTNSSNV